ncbi:hypothetical protein CVT26_006534 [Gymnopilus dilepis]|uniref:Uncharacterized protein n=1 Tax=Gymnopilus dilepis TaxID=231916 RepID=A0A409Y3F8_9AGAR|nr:hypothetical protein CVT26_006534 [Gymnopilus dilepis]
MSPNASSSGSPLLPFLENFSWDACFSYPWDTIPGLLEPITNGRTPHRRPLKAVSIYCYETNFEITLSYIPKEVIKRLSNFSGVKFEFVFDSYRTEKLGIDWLKASLESLDEGKEEATAAI